MGKKMVVRYEPLGLIGVIGPWNYPLTNSFGDCIPALLAGNSVILKPSEVTPLTSLLLAEGLAESGLPDGVFQVATGRGETGAALVDEVDMIMFTGSTATGKKVMARAAQTLTPVALELGGKDPMIVLADADLERAANLAVYYSMLNGGQTCISIERVYVEEPVYDEFVRKVVDKVGALRQGESTGPATVEVGAMTFPKQLEIVEEHVRDALAKGARALTGGKRRPGKGLFYEPTVLVDVDHTMKAMTEETFGPTLPIMKVADAEEALRARQRLAVRPRRARSSAATASAAEQIARRLQAGAVCVNDALLNYVAVELPMGGWKASGLGHAPRRRRDPEVHQAAVAVHQPACTSRTTSTCSRTGRRSPRRSSGACGCSTAAAGGAERRSPRRGRAHHTPVQWRRWPRSPSGCAPPCCGACRTTSAG